MLTNLQLLERGPTFRTQHVIEELPTSVYLSQKLSSNDLLSMGFQWGLMVVAKDFMDLMRLNRAHWSH